MIEPTDETRQFEDALQAAAEAGHEALSRETDRLAHQESYGNSPEHEQAMKELRNAVRTAWADAEDALGELTLVLEDIEEVEDDGV